MDLKDFFKPTIGKVAVLILLVIFSFFLTFNIKYVRTDINDPNSAAKIKYTLKCENGNLRTPCDKAKGLPFPFYTKYYDVGTPIVNYSYLIIDILFWYLFSISAVFIFNKVKK